MEGSMDMVNELLCALAVQCAVVLLRFHFCNGAGSFLHVEANEAGSQEMLVKKKVFFSLLSLVLANHGFYQLMQDGPHHFVVAFPFRMLRVVLSFPRQRFGRHTRDRRVAKLAAAGAPFQAAPFLRVPHGKAQVAPAVENGHFRQKPTLVGVKDRLAMAFDNGKLGVGVRGCFGGGSRRFRRLYFVFFVFAHQQRKHVVVFLSFPFFSFLTKKKKIMQG